MCNATIIFIQNRLQSWIYIPVLVLSGCYGLETDISKKPDFDVYISSIDSFEATNFGIIHIPSHPEMADFMEYAVFPDPYKVNSISYRIRDIAPWNTAQEISMEVSYRNVAMDTIPLFQVSNVPVIEGDRIEVNIGASDLSIFSQQVNTQPEFLMIVHTTGDSESIDYYLDVYFDTTITVDYEL